MAQVTDSLLAEFQARVDRDQHINSTVGEEAQLLHGFREWKRMTAYAVSSRELLERAVTTMRNARGAITRYVAYDDNTVCASLDRLANEIEALVQGPMENAVRTPVCTGAARQQSAEGVTAGETAIPAQFPHIPGTPTIDEIRDARRWRAIFRAGICYHNFADGPFTPIWSGSKRIWFHETNDIQHDTFAEMIDAYDQRFPSYGDSHEGSTAL